MWRNDGVSRSGGWFGLVFGHAGGLGASSWVGFGAGAGGVAVDLLSWWEVAEWRAVERVDHASAMR